MPRQDEQGLHLSNIEMQIMLEREPTCLLDLVARGSLEPTTLTYAAEFLGEIPERFTPQAKDSIAVPVPSQEDIIAALETLTRHAKSYVREGAVCGLANLGTEAAMRLVQKVAQEDRDKDVRSVAQGALDQYEQMDLYRQELAACAQQAEHSAESGE